MRTIDSGVVPIWEDAAIAATPLERLFDQALNTVVIIKDADGLDCGESIAAASCG